MFAEQTRKPESPGPKSKTGAERAKSRSNPESPNPKSGIGPERKERELSIRNHQISGPASPPGEKNSGRANPKSPNPKSDGALGEERAMSETERAPVMSLIKSYRTSLLNPTGVQDTPSLSAHDLLYRKFNGVSVRQVQ